MFFFSKFKIITWNFRFQICFYNLDEGGKWNGKDGSWWFDMRNTWKGGIQINLPIPIRIILQVWPKKAKEHFITRVFTFKSDTIEFSQVLGHCNVNRNPYLHLFSNSNQVLFSLELDPKFFFFVVDFFNGFFRYTKFLVTTLLDNAKMYYFCLYLLTHPKDQFFLLV